MVWLYVDKCGRVGGCVCVSVGSECGMYWSELVCVVRAACVGVCAVTGVCVC